MVVQNIQAKSAASKIKWLIDLCVLPELTTHMDLITRLMGDQKGRCNGRDLFFITTYYARRILRIDSPFYKESIKAMTTLELRKQVLDPRDEKLFYNPTFQGELGHTLNVTKSCARAGVYTYGQLLDEVAERDKGRQHCRNVTNLLDRIAVRDLEERQQHLLITVGGNVPFHKVSQKLFYAQLVKLNYRDQNGWKDSKRPLNGIRYGDSYTTLFQRKRPPRSYGNRYTSTFIQHTPIISGTKTLLAALCAPSLYRMSSISFSSVQS